MMPPTIATAVYLVAGVLFILSLRGLSTQESAGRGNVMGMVGMLLAVAISVLALFDLRVGEAGQAAAAATPTSTNVLLTYGAALALGGLIGGFVAARVQMTAMPELVAILHSFVGLAAVLVGLGTQLEMSGHIDVAHYVEVQLGVFVGAVTFTGSVVALAQPRGTIRSRARRPPWRGGAGGLRRARSPPAGGGVAAARAGGPVRRPPPARAGAPPPPRGCGAGLGGPVGPGRGPPRRSVVRLSARAHRVGVAA